VEVRAISPAVPKVFGEWFIWPETDQMIDWGLERSARFGTDVLFASEEGRPWYNEANKNPQAKFTNVLKRLVERVQKSEPDFRVLPFGTLRDTLPCILRARHSSEMASICLCHGSTFKGDKLLDCYTNKPFGRFHNLMREARSYFTPMFETAPDDPTSDPIQQYIPLKIREKIRTMLANGEPPAKIARECGVSTMTVYREKERTAG
jgi:hypothetical protein